MGAMRSHTSRETIRTEAILAKPREHLDIERNQVGYAQPTQLVQGDRDESRNRLAR